MAVFIKNVQWYLSLRDSFLLLVEVTTWEGKEETHPARQALPHPDQAHQRNKRIQETRDNTLILNAQTSEQGPRIPAISATSNRLPYIRLQFKQRKEKYTTYGWKISYCHDNLWISRQKEGAKWVEIIRAFSATNQSQREEWCVRCARRHWEIFLLENIQRNHSLLDWRWK